MASAAAAANDKPELRFPPRYITQQGKNAPTFTPPPLDGSLPVGEFVDWHMQYSEFHNHCLLVEEGDHDNVPITYGEFGRAVHRVARQIQDAVPEGPARPNGKPKTIALLSGADTLTYNTVMLGVIRAGFEVFPISSRNSEAGIKHLITVVDARYLLGSVGAEGKAPTALEQSIQTVLSELETDKYEFKLIPEPHFSDLYPRLSQRPVPPYDRDADIQNTVLLPRLTTMESYVDADEHTHPCLIMHSSGSTKFPKAIRQNQQAMRHWMDWLWYGDEDLGGTVCSAVGLPGFHAGGITYGLGHTIGSGVTMVHFMPAEPPIQANPDTALYSFKKSKCDWCFGIPAFLDSWSNDPETIKYLATKDGITFGSSPLPEEAGDRLIAGGVNLINVYGATEAGIVTHVSFKRRTDWLYTQVSSMVNHRLHPDDEEGDVYRLVFEANDHYSPSVYNIPGEPAYDTNDVAVPHPTEKNRYRILGRSDDQIMHSTGEKTNPGPLENIIAGCSLIKSAVYFGRARPQAGVIIEPFKAIDITSDEVIAEFRNTIWPYVDRANKFGPSHSRVFKEYILVADPLTKPLARTPKGSIARSQVLKQYEKEIDQIYATVHEVIQYEWATPPASWDDQGILAFMSRVVNGVLETDVDPQRDLFEQGCDSLQATLIRNTIIKALRSRLSPTKEDDEDKPTDPSRKMPQNVIFAYPTVVSLAGFVVQLVQGSDEEVRVNDHLRSMHDLVEKYSSNWASKQANGTHIPITNGHSELQCVLLTGSTGTLGAYLLSTLLLDERVKRVYAFNRPNGTRSVLERQRQAFADRGIPEKLAEHPKLVLLEGDTAEARLDVDASVYEELLSSVTCIIHNAWRLDFNMGVSSFQSHIRGSKNLMDLALTSKRASKPKFLFTSSIGTVGNWNGPDPVPEVPLDAEVALGTGYGESKWVVDRIMIEATAQCGLPTTTFRIGQLAGSLTNGAWNTTDWLPHIIKAGCILGSLPLVGDDEVISWLSVDAAAISIVEAMYQSDPGNHTLHVVHPYPTTWNTVMTAMHDYLTGKGRKLELEPYATWFQKLEASASEPDAIQKNPALKLLDFLRAGTKKDGVEREAMAFPRIDTTKMKEVSETLRNLKTLDKVDVDRWMQYWDSHGLFA